MQQALTSWNYFRLHNGLCEILHSILDCTIRCRIYSSILFYSRPIYRQPHRNRLTNNVRFINDLMAYRFVSDIKGQVWSRIKCVFTVQIFRLRGANQLYWASWTSQTCCMHVSHGVRTRLAPSVYNCFNDKPTNVWELIKSEQERQNQCCRWSIRIE